MGSNVSPSSATELGPAPNVTPVLSMVKRILIIVAVCMLAFLYRAVCIVYLFQWKDMKWPDGFLLPYYIFSEVVPIALLLFLYLLPGLEAIWHCCVSGRRSVCASVIEGQLGLRSTVI